MVFRKLKKIKSQIEKVFGINVDKTITKYGFPPVLDVALLPYSEKKEDLSESFVDSFTGKEVTIKRRRYHLKNGVILSVIRGGEEEFTTYGSSEGLLEVGVFDPNGKFLLSQLDGWKTIGDVIKKAKELSEYKPITITINYGKQTKTFKILPELTKKEEIYRNFYEISQG